MVDARRTPHAPRRSEANWSLALALLIAVLAAIGAPSCLDSRARQQDSSNVGRCASCHGDAARSGSYLERSAPPRDLLGLSDPSSPGVGAHAQHLRASATHGPVACDECHVVPDRVDAPGHADDARPAELVFGELARTGHHAPTYDAQVRTCRDSYCHGDSHPHWTEPKTSADACGSCHGLPPPAPHPQSDRCFVCHADVIDENRRFVAPERHVDGVVDYRAGECRQCHGGAQNAAPPRDVTGHSSTRALGVGAHQAHLSGGQSGRPLACDECHRVPDKLEDATHADGLPAEVALTGVAASGERKPSWHHDSATCTDSWCHSPSANTASSSPVWNAATNLGCQSCHGMPPPAPHPQISNCAHCHGAVVAADNLTIVDRARHVDGHVDVAFDPTCSSCHGDAKTNPAPPRDLAGNIDESSPGVGAHQSHVNGTSRSRAVPCGECHVVPKNVLDPGHVDTALPAELAFSGVALAHGASPVYRAGSCQMSSCHGAVFPEGHSSGGSNTTPSWTRVDGSQAACGTCHGLPPPPPHPYPSYPCHVCHFDLAEDDVTFTRPELHVDGIVTFALP